MKKILIVNKSFELGGIQSSMINMANELSQYYEVHLFVYNPTGVMKERLNSNVTVLEPSWRFKCLGMSLKDALKTRSLRVVLFRVFAALWSKVFDNRLPINMAIKHQKRLTGYDLAVSYHQEQRKKSVVSGFARVVDQCVEAKKKVAWLHFDSATIDLDSAYNNPFYKQMDKVVCVSRSLMETFSQKNPPLSEKMDYCYNFMLYDVMREKSKLQQEIPYPPACWICFSACRLTEEKALVRAIRALSDVLKKHRDVMWFIAGDGVERNNIEAAIREYGLEKQIVLIGNQSNPYPYILHANLVLNVSYHEAAPMIFFESKALGVPVFATRTSSAEELLNDRLDSFICENSEDGIKSTFAWLMENRVHVDNARAALGRYAASNDESIRKIKELIE